MRRHLIALSTLTVVALTAATVSTPAYNISGRRWAVNPVPFYVNPANADVTQTAALSAILAGATAWSTQSLADVSWYYMGSTNATTVGANGKNEVFFRPDTGSGAIATTYWWTDSNNRLVDADIVFYDGSYTFFTGNGGCNNGFFLEDVATHEFGHALGISHSDVGAATMVSGTGACNMEKRTLDFDDVAAVEALYPPAGTSPTQPPPNPETSEPPAVPSGPNPADRAVDVQPSSLGWAAVPGATQYAVFFGTTAAPAFYRTVTDPFVDLPRISAGTTYYWRVEAINSVGSAQSPVWTFTTRAKPGKGGKR